MKNAPPKPTNELEAYRRLANHERRLWVSMLAVMIMSGTTIAILTMASNLSEGSDPARVYLFAGLGLVLLSIFTLYMAMNRQGLEHNRESILRELESRSAQLSEANQTLETALRTRETLLNNVSHELKTPLTAMLAYAEYLGSESLPPEETQRHAEAIQHEGRSLLRLIHQLVDLSALRSGIIQLRWACVDLAGIAEAVRERLKTEAEGKDVRLEVRVPPEPVLTWVDETRMLQALEALVHHALLHSPAGSRVLIGVEPLDEDWNEVVVEDQSPRAELAPEQMLEPFSMLDPEAPGRRGDLGLGLPLAQRLVLAHGGLLRISTVEPQGLRIRIQLPQRSAGSVTLDLGSDLPQAAA